MGRKYQSTNYFSPFDSNTVCDITGHKVKKSHVMRRWEGLYVIPEAWHPRHPQDTPIIPVKQTVYENVRAEEKQEGAVAGFDTI